MPFDKHNQGVKKYNKYDKNVFFSIICLNMMSVTDNSFRSIPKNRKVAHYSQGFFYMRSTAMSHPTIAYKHVFNWKRIYNILYLKE